ncbi:MAG TPA: DUF1501 domain-containing protein [Paraburkholderia sp.]|jgi:uncharacterized protein (DUF1501 family)|nr:DUF1501 domain-containing protein [Paraburkholderia sp.]
MKRRDFLAAAAVAGASWSLSRIACAQDGAGPAQSDALSRGYDNLLILVELKGGNDALNTVVPFADPLYYRYRPRVAVRRDAAIALDEHTALHPSLAPLMPLWRSQQLAIVQGVGYAQPNLSHFRSIEIWETASHPQQYLRDGWLARAFAQRPVPTGFAADGIVLGSAEKGPFANGARTLALVPSDAARALRSTFPPGRFGASIRTAMEALAASNNEQRVPAIRLTLNGFDTHCNQPDRHAALLAEFATGMMAMRDALVEMGCWHRTLIVTYSEFGRNVRENDRLGTDHGTVAAHFVTGGRVRGGLYGDAPRVAHIDGNGHLPVGVDFRRIYATVLGSWWGLDPRSVLQQRFDPLPLLSV